MHFTELIAGVLQFGVAGYALRLNRLFGPARVGWSLFCAFALLALLHVIQAVVPSHAAAQITQFGGEIEAVYALISLLLFTGMLHLETVLKARMKAEREEERLRAELELEVIRKTAHLTRAIEELQAEIDARERAETEVAATHLELRTVSCQAAMGRFATGVLEKVTEMIRSVNVSASLVSDQVKNSKIANVVNVGNLIRNTPDLGRFMTHDPRGQKLPVYIAQLAEHLAAEQAALQKELESLRTNLEKVTALEQDYAKLSGVANMAGVAGLRQSPVATDSPEFLAEAGLGASQEVLAPA